MTKWKAASVAMIASSQSLALPPLKKRRSLWPGTAQHISSAIIQALENNIYLTRQTICTKLVGFGSDGASVMTECKSGVGSRCIAYSPAGTGIQQQNLHSFAFFNLQFAGT